MKSYFGKTKRVIMGVFAAVLMAAVMTVPVAVAEDDNMVGFSMSPMDQKIVLEPGDSYTSSLKIHNPGTHTTDVEYEISVEPFYVNDDYTTIFENVGNRGMMTNWITIDSPTTGTLKPNETAEIMFTINVPSDAPAGGQYATVLASSHSKGQSGDGVSPTIDEVRRIGHLIFAEIAGNTVRQGEIVDANVPSFLLSGNIAGTSAIKNTGNVHGVATYKLQVFPLFSDEEVYTNVEDPETHTILPDRTLYNETAWENTPTVGIFNVVYTVEFEGVTTQVSKMVIVCPVWLLFIIFFVIAAIIIWIVMRARGRKKTAKRAEAAKASE
ncbi:hypothetical protein IKF89_01790 [Candidatus Saccharibacteria bacterium]|nr:hypothetical protein [Candidatus Saccharibacteria bacterium]